MAATTKSDIPGYDVVRQLDELRNPVFRVRRMPSEDIFVAKLLGPQYEPRLPGQRNKTARRLSKILDTTIGWVPVEDHGQAPDGQSFVVYPLYERGSLADRLDGEPEPWAEAVRWVTGASLTVGNLHDEGIALGQLRASTILISDGDEPHVSVYGLATRRFDDGTFRFEAPEVLDGKDPSPASDTYSLALILATLIIGRTPEFGESLDDFLPLLDESCPNAVKAVLAKSLQKDPSARHNDGTVFAHSVRAAAQDAMVEQYSTNSDSAEDSDNDPAEPAPLPIEEPVVDLGSPKPLSVSSSAVPPTVEPVSLASESVATKGTSPDLLDDVIMLATATAPLPALANGLSNLPPAPKISGSPSDTDSPDPGSIAAEDALQELEQLVVQAPPIPPETWTPPANDQVSTSRPGNARDNRTEVDAKTKASDPEPTKATSPSSPKLVANRPFQDLETPDNRAPFSPQPKPNSNRVGSTPPRGLRAVALRVEQFWYANRRSVATTFATVAVLAIAGVAAVLAFQNFQEERVATAEGAPVPTTEKLIVADENNEISFITEPPQTNTTTTTTRPPRRTTTTAKVTTPAPATTTDEEEEEEEEEESSSEEEPPEDEEEQPDEE